MFKSHEVIIHLYKKRQRNKDKQGESLPLHNSSTREKQLCFLRPGARQLHVKLWEAAYEMLFRVSTNAWRHHESLFDRKIRFYLSFSSKFFKKKFPKSCNLVYVVLRSTQESKSPFCKFVTNFSAWTSFISETVSLCISDCL